MKVKTQKIVSFLVNSEISNTLEIQEHKILSASIFSSASGDQNGTPHEDLEGSFHLLTTWLFPGTMVPLGWFLFICRVCAHNDFAATTHSYFWKKSRKPTGDD